MSLLVAEEYQMCRLRPSNLTLCEALARLRLQRTRTHSGDYSTIGCHRNCQNLLPLHKTGSEKNEFVRSQFTVTNSSSRTSCKSARSISRASLFRRDIFSWMTKNELATLTASDHESFCNSPASSCTSSRRRYKWW